MKKILAFYRNHIKYPRKWKANERSVNEVTITILGIIYDVIVEPPSIGSTTDENGNSKPVS